MEKILGWLGGICIAVFILYTIVFNFVHFCYWWKCRKKKYGTMLNRCHEKGCKWSRFCDKHEQTFTREDIAELKAILADYQKMTEKNS